MAQEPSTTPFRLPAVDPGTGPVRLAEPRTDPGARTAGGKPPHTGEGEVALFRSHLFPIGHMPTPRTRPVRQLPVPATPTQWEGEPVKAEALEGCLATVGIPAALLSVGAERDDAWCVLRGEQGAWDVFWREQGNRYDWVSFEDEATACHYLLGRLVWAQTVRGAVGVLDAEDTGQHKVYSRSSGS